MLNTLSSVSVRESRIQYLCDPQWLRDTASRGPTIIAAPESQFRACPTDHDSIGYPRMSASGESSTTMHRLLHASGSHPIPPPDDPNASFPVKLVGARHLDASKVPQLNILPLRPRSGIQIRRCANSGIGAKARICQYMNCTCIASHLKF
ncbi:hypothetical protein F511_15747 [Dorcoceras hygrometricum]|uniref:Uncharacterized protein n=1 Tax=Dorcoceras hygrometricum TaxID=472368 RepID=A0A2Z7B4K7_9LAMI|nr:hypothetical protein F511_15747 [Dorcoceras hygrometricum]